MPTEAVPIDVWQSTPAIAMVAIIAMTVVQAAFAFAKYAMSRHNNKAKPKPEHGERLAVVETEVKELRRSQGRVEEKVTCIDGNVNRILALQQTKARKESYDGDGG